MKKLNVLVFISLIPLFGFSQSLFDKYEEMNNVGSVIINKGMIQLAGTIAAMDEGDQDAQDFKDIADGLNGIKVFITEDDEISKDMNKTVKRYLRTSSMEELMRVKHKDANVKFYIKNGRDENHVTELLMFVSEINHDKMDVHGRKFESVLVSMTGDIDLNKISAITNKMNLPRELNEAGNR